MYLIKVWDNDQMIFEGKSKIIPTSDHQGWYQHQIIKDGLLKKMKKVLLKKLNLIPLNTG